MLLRCVKGKAPLIDSNYRSTVVPTSDSSNCDQTSECAHKHVQVHVLVHTRRNTGGAWLRMAAAFDARSARARTTTCTRWRCMCRDSTVRGGSAASSVEKRATHSSD